MRITSSNDLGDKIAFVQGGSRGIGAAIVSKLAEQRYSGFHICKLRASSTSIGR